jgi:hypothetical protein
LQLSINSPWDISIKGILPYEVKSLDVGFKYLGFFINQIVILWLIGVGCRKKIKKKFQIGAIDGSL